MHSSSLLTCTALSDYGPEEGQCFSTGGCPLLGLDVGGFSSMNIATNSNNNLCNVLKTLQQDCLNGETVRLIVFGGSVTTGHSTCGCCGRSVPSNVCTYSYVISHRNYSDEDANMNYCSYAIKHAVNLDSEFCNLIGRHSYIVGWRSYLPNATYGNCILVYYEWIDVAQFVIVFFLTFDI